jgi:hypothetical protein
MDQESAMSQFIPLNEYRALVKMERSSTFQWPTKHFLREEVVARVRASLGKLPFSYLGAQGGPSLRPLGLMSVRLLLELGELTHSRGDGEVLVAPSFVQEGKVPLRWSAEAPWGLDESSASAIDEFLRVALVDGDAVLSRDDYENAMKEFSGMVIRRSFQLRFRGGPGGGNMAFEVGAFQDPGEGPEEWENLQFAYLEGGRLVVIDCGMPVFGTFDGTGMIPVRPPVPIPGFPKVYEVVEGGVARRVWVPMSEPGAVIGLTGFAFVEGANRTQVCRSLGDGEDPVIRVHLAYVPGWRVNQGAGGTYCWSELSAEFQDYLEEQAAEVVNL